ncbi:MAG: c-type cytochrome, partial [Gammaproteobacteria bacterium]|nr:c-type cytochrome [Gammaproteobacteria bacterium]
AFARGGMGGGGGGGGMGGGGGGGGDPVAGEALYQGICFACHGTDAGGRFVRTSIRGVGPGRISMMINMRPEMNLLSYLTSTEIDNIAAYLGTLPSTSNPERLSGSGNYTTGEAKFRENCTGCHAMGTSARTGPDLIDVTNSRRPVWVQAFIAEPTAMISHSAFGDGLENYPYWMSDTNLSDYDALDISAYLNLQQVRSETPPKTLSEAELDATKDLYFNRCAGCHGLYRTGATGPVIDEARSQEIGTDGLRAMLLHGSPAGMPNFGTSGILSDTDMDNLAAFLQLPPPEAPALPMPEIQASWQVFVPVADRPTSPQTTRDWENYVGAVLRDDGKIAIFDGDTREEVARVDVGFAVHILRSSSSGRYFYAIGRDGLVTLIDLWASTPNVVAQVKGCHDARSVDGSKLPGYEDKYLIEGCYWPPQYVVYDGLTLEPLTRQDVPMVNINGETLPEVRVAAIVASHTAPVWLVNLKESGYVGVVDYSQPDFPLVSNIATELFLHDGGLDSTGKYFLAAANASNKMVVVDIDSQSFVTSIEVGNVPHPGRGVDWVDPVYGPVNATPHIGSAFVSVYGTDPVNYPENAWKVVREIPLPASGSLFIKSHPNSPWVLVDMTLSSTNDKQICAIAKSTGTVDRCFDVAVAGKAVHQEFNRDGSQVWISDWAGSGGGQVVLDGTTLEVIERITLPATTGKFNVYNTAHDIY